MVRFSVLSAAACASLILLAGCSAPEAAKVETSRANSSVETSTQETGVPAPSPVATPVPDVVREEPDLPVDFATRIPSAVALGASRGAEVSIALLDRKTGAYFEGGDSSTIATASVSKLFIADEVLFRSLQRGTPVSDDDNVQLGAMLTSSGDNAANVLWEEYGGSDIIDSVVNRYGLDDTTPPYDGSWWNTITDAADLVKYYAGLLGNTGGLTVDRSQVVVDLLRQSTEDATDGYPQWFGIADALPQEPIRGVKQGWMCCVSGRWVHLSTGVLGADNRYILVVNSQETVNYDGGPRGNPDTSETTATTDASARHARDTMTEVVRNLFPQGQID